MTPKNHRYLALFICLSFFIGNRVTAQGSATSDISNIAAAEEKRYTSSVENARMQGNAVAARTQSSNNFDVNFYRCEWEIDPNVRFIKGKITSYFTITSASNNIVFDLSDTLSVDSISYRGNLVAFQKTGTDGLQIQFPTTLPAGQKDSVSVYYNGIPRQNPTVRSFTKSTQNGIPIIWTLSEPFGAKEWWPCKNGLDDKSDSIEIIIKNPAGYQSSSNGVMTDESIVNGFKISTWKHHYPIASYLVALAITNYVVLKDTVVIGTKTMDLIDYVYPGYESLFDSQRFVTKAALHLFGQLFGDYPFAKEKYGFTQFGAGGGMEHQTNSFINNPGISLLEHETAHQWFGDKVTCASWQDVWLNEGFATYCQVLFNQYVDTANFYPILQNMTRDLTRVPNGSVWVSDTTNANRIFNTGLSYYKGAWLLHMLRWKTGDAVFFRAINKYLNDQKLQYGYAKTADLKQHLETESGQDLTSFFAKWFYGEGFPSYSCTWSQNKNNWAYVQINQTTSHNSVSFYEMPVQLKFMSATRDTLITVDNQQPGQSFWVNPGFSADSMAVDPNYWILAKTRVTQKIPAKSSVTDELHIYPNPAPDKINISLANPTAAKITMQLYNVSGQLVYKTEKQLTGSDELFQITVSQLAHGMYILRVSDNKSINLQKNIIR